jgi:ABC-type polysaccharide/polyol phosphate export permease
MYFRNFFYDLKRAVYFRHIWINIALAEIKGSYKRTKLGPLWISLSTIILLFSMGPLYSVIFKTDFKSYFVYLACGFVFWALIKDILLESSNEYVNSQSYILSQPYPISIYIFKCVFKNLIIFLHNFIIVLIATTYFTENLTILNFLTFLLGLFINLLILFFVGLSLSVICLRYRDVSNIIQNLFTVFFFITPILWKPSLLEGKTAFIYGNIFFSMIDVMRSPLIGNQFPTLSFIICIIALFFSILISIYFFGKYKNKVALWS